MCDNMCASVVPFTPNSQRTRVVQHKCATHCASNRVLHSLVFTTFAAYAQLMCAYAARTNEQTCLFVSSRSVCAHQMRVCCEYSQRTCAYAATYAAYTHVRCNLRTSMRATRACSNVTRSVHAYTLHKSQRTRKYASHIRSVRACTLHKYAPYVHECSLREHTCANSAHSCCVHARTLRTCAAYSHVRCTLAHVTRKRRLLGFAEQWSLVCYQRKYPTHK